MAQLKLRKFFSVLMVLMLIASVGAVVVPASPVVAQAQHNWYVDGTRGTDDDTHGTGPGANAFKTIQYAINDSRVTAGDTIKVAAGEYIEQVVINKSLTIKGAGASSTTIKAPDSPGSYKFIESGSWWEPVVFAFGGTNNSGSISGTGTITVTISGFTIDGNNRVPSDRSAGILLRNASGSISNNTVRNMSIDGKATYGIAAYGDSDVVISGNNVSGYSKGGIVANGDNGTNPDPNAIITGNTVTGPGMDATLAPNGIQIGFGATGKVTGNTVSGNGYPGTDWTGTGILVATSNGVEVDDNTVTGNETGIGTNGMINDTLIHDNMVDGNNIGISIQNKAVNTTIENNIIKNSSYDGIGICNFGTSYGAPPIDTTIQGNTITANNTENDETLGGIWIDEGVDGNKVSINFNNIVGNNGFGVINDSTTNTIDATNNWWGANDGPSDNGTGHGDEVSANVTFDPWLVLKLRADPASIPADGTSPSTITADMTKNSHNKSTTGVPDGTTINFVTTGGTLSKASKNTTSGIASITLTSSTTAGTVTVTGTAPGNGYYARASTDVEFTPAGISTAPPQSHGAGGMASVTPPQGPMPLPNMLVQSAAITAGKQVSAKVANTGGASGSLRVTLYAGNSAMESKNVSLAPGDIATVSFDASSLGPGTYNIKVNNVPAGQLTVEGDSSSLLFISLAAFLVLMAVLFIIYFRRRRTAG